MIQLSDIHSLTDFQRNTKEFVQRMKETGRPIVLTVNGKAELVVQDAESYQRMLDQLDRLEAIEGIRKGLDDVRNGRTRPFEEAMDELSRRHEVHT